MIFYDNNFYFEDLLFRTFLITKLKIENLYELPHFKYIKCGIKLSGLKTLTDPRILRSLEALELVTTKKPKITKISSGFFKNIENTLKLESKLEKKIFWNFLAYYSYFLKPISKSKKIGLDIKVLDDKIFIYVEDLSLFVHLEEKFLKEKLEFFIEFKFDKNLNLKDSFSQKQLKRFIYAFFA